MNRGPLGYVAAILAVGAGALLFRLPGLGLRPVHPDEANQAYKAGRLLFEEGRYAYDPHDHHGPTLYYLTLPALRWSGAKDFAATDEADYRVVPVLFGAGAVLLVGLLGDALGRRAAVGAAVLAAASPAMVFYSRYYIQESLLVFFTLALMGCAWRYVRTGRAVWAVLAGGAVGLMHATKETWVIAAAAMLAALAAVLVLERWPTGRWAAVRPYLRLWLLLAAVGAALAIVIALYTSFFTRARGPIDSILAYVYYAQERAGGAGLHDNPWHFYLQRLVWFHEGPGPVWTEGLIVGLALVGGVSALTGWGAGPRPGGAGAASRPFLRFLLFYTAAVTAAYSLVPYKTPWCVLTMLQGMMLLAGVGAVALWRGLVWAPARAVLAAVLAVGAVHLGGLAWQANFDPRFYADPRNPYVYSHTSTGVRRLVDFLERLQALERPPAGLRVNVLMPENYWPLPWYLRRFQARYAHGIPADPDAPVVITTPDFAPQLEPRLGRPYVGRAHYGLRFGFPVRVYVERGLWEKFEASCAPAAPGPVKPEEAAGEGGPAPARRFAHAAMATEFEVLIAGLDEARAAGAAQAAFDELDRLEEDLSRFRSASDVSRINRLSPGQEVRVGPATMECLTAAAAVARSTGGAFDVTVGPILDLYRGPGGASRAPPPEALAAALARVGMDRLVLDAAEHTVGVRSAGVRVDLGGIGKGYALDRMGAILRQWGAGSALLHGGRSTALALGPPPGRPGWRVDVRRPDTGEVLGTVVLRGRALSVSGPGEGGAARIVDPRTGRPAAGKANAWAAAPTAAEADALSTAFLVMTPEEVKEYCARRPDVSAMLLLEGEGGGRAIRFGRWGE